MKIEDIFGIATWGQLEFDPTRPRLYFTESRPDKQTNRQTSRIMFMNTDASSGDTQSLTAGPGDTLPKPSPDGRTLAFLSRRSGSSQVWLLPLEGGEASQLTSIQGGIKQFTWAPGSDSIIAVAHITDGKLDREQTSTALPSDASDEELDAYYNSDVRHIDHQYYKLDGEGFFDDGRDQLVAITTDGESELLTNGRDHYGDPVFSPDGQTLFCLYRAYDPEGPHPGVTRVLRLTLASKEFVPLQLPDWSIGGLSVSPDGNHLAFYASKPKEMGYGLTALYRFNLATGELTDLSSVLNRCVGDESSTDIPASSSAKPTWYGDSVLMQLSDSGRVTLTKFQREGIIRLWDEKRVVYDFSVKGNEVALAIADPTHPSGILRVQFGSTDETVSFAPTPWDDDTSAEESCEGPVAPLELWATESDGTQIQTWCLMPRGAGPHPTILEIHGGPMSMYGYRYFHEFQCLVQAGYAVVYTNPRGSQGYGHDFCKAIVGQWGDKDYRDVMAGLDAALATWPDLDANRLGTAGGSYGGFMVNWIVSHSDRFKAAVTMRSVVNRFSAMGASDMGWLRIPQYGTKPWWEEPEPYWQQSPLKYASNIHTPLLIEHQEKDFRLPIEQGEQLYSALKYLSREVEMVLYPDESHGMSRNGKPWHRIHRLRTNTAWFNKYLQN